MSGARMTAGLVRACHPGPTLAVTVLTGLFALGSGMGAARAAVLLLAVLTGQLVIGWSNDLIDAGRDRRVGRRDKPIATGELAGSVVARALVAALVATVVGSVALGPRAGAIHLLLVVGGGLSYNAGLKRTGWSFVPYLVAFGALPAVVTSALRPPVLPPAWVMAAAGLLGVGAHFVNVLPDLEDDAATGVAGLPHRLGRARLRVVAPLVLLAATLLLLLAPAGAPTTTARVGAGVVLVLVVVSIRGPGRVPFYGAIAIALVDVLMLVTSL